MKYIKYFGGSEKNLKVLINDIVNIAKGQCHTDTLIQYGIKLAAHERQLKRENK